MNFLVYFTDGLNVNPATLKANTMKGHQWTNQQPAIRTGGQNFQMTGIARSTLPAAGFAQSMPISGGLRCPQTMPPISQTAQYGYAMQQVYININLYVDLFICKNSLDTHNPIYFGRMGCMIVVLEKQS